MSERSTVGDPWPPSHGLTQSERLVALFRLPTLALLVAGLALRGSGEELIAAAAVLGVFGLWSLAQLAIVHRRAVTQPLALVSTLVDIAAITTLVGLSGGPHSQARFAYVLVPLAAGFRFRPPYVLTATGVILVAYLVQGYVHPSRDYDFLWLQAGYLALVGAIAWAGATMLVQRTRQSVRLAEQRSDLLADALEIEERERKRLAEAIHDSSLQSLLLARHALDAQREGGGGRADLETAREAISGTIDELREAVFELHPYVLDQVGLAAAIKAVALRAAKQGDFVLDLRLDPDVRTDIDAALFSTVRELLANVVHHAHATEAHIELTRSDGEVVLRVADDGIGLDPDQLAGQLANGHIGLASQRARVEAIGGTLEIEGVAQGTEVVVRVPARARSRTGDLSQGT